MGDSCGAERRTGRIPRTRRQNGKGIHSSRVILTPSPSIFSSMRSYSRAIMLAFCIVDLPSAHSAAFGEFNRLHALVRKFWFHLYRFLAVC